MGGSGRGQGGVEGRIRGGTGGDDRQELDAGGII